MLKAGLYILMVVVVAVVLLDWFGVIDTLGDDDDRQRNDRAPAEHLYLDDERTDAYLGQIEGGLSPKETRTQKRSRARQAKVGVKDAVELGGNITEEEGVESTVSLSAADRYYQLETRLSERFGSENGETKALTSLSTAELRDQLIARDSASSETAPQEGEFVKITDARVAVPTYALGLAKIAHAQPFRSPGQRERRRRVFRNALTEFASSKQGELRRYTQAIGADPRLPFRVTVPGAPGSEPQGSGSNTATIFLPIRYSKLADAPSLLTGKITIVGKVVRRAPQADSDYYDVETAVTYRRALEKATPGVRRVLAVPRGAIGATVNASARVESPALVVIPVAIYK